MALIITLILLSVTLIMAVAFLAIARRERNAVSTTTDTAIARLATDSALAAAEAQMAANVFATANQGAYNYGLLVSTNYINPLGYVPGSQSPTNVNYDNRFGGGALNAADLEQNIANLWLLPRAPVFVPTNNGPGYDFRFWLDLNQNRRFEGNGPQPQIDAAGFFIHTDGTVDSANPVNVATNFMVGDPEWIGVLERPDQPHSPNNHFVARYAFIAQPIGNSLDLNYIHNNARRSLGGANDGYLRNQGVGSWELNLAAFLADLNTNQWFEDPSGLPSYYDYEPFYISGPISQNRAFDESLALLNYRYGGNYGNLASVNNTFFNTANYPFNIDGYSDGPLQTTVNTNAAFPSDPIAVSWSGADNTNRFFNLASDLFDSSKTATGVSPVAVAAGNYFSGHLAAAGSGNATYDRYTYYRLFDQLGTGSAADSGKLNLNYSNAVVSYNSLGVVTNIAIVPGAETNLVSWSATNFFHAAANQLLRAYTATWFQSAPRNYVATYYGTNLPGYLAANGVGVTNLQYLGQLNEIPTFGATNIPVYVNGQFVYTPAVNRLLQLAANMYDATTTNFYPSVFRPILERTGTNIFIAGFKQVVSVIGPNDLVFTKPYNVEALAGSGSLPQNTPIVDAGGNLVNAYGVPWVIGAKKNMPGLNQFSMLNAAQVQRALEVVRATVAGRPVATNQLVQMDIHSGMGVSFWNSYSNDYVGSGLLSATVVSTVQMALTNSDWTALATTNFTANWYFPFANNRWPGSMWGAGGSGQPAVGSFASVVWTNSWATTNEAYNFATKRFTSDIQSAWDPTLSPLPQLGLLVTNQLQAYIVDGTHVLDYVQLRDPIAAVNVNSVLNDPSIGGAPNYYMWATTNYNNTWPSWGIVDQLEYSRKNLTVIKGIWNMAGAPAGTDPIAWSRAYFDAAWKPAPHSFTLDGKIYYNTNQLVSQAPFTPVRTVYVPYLYQVNDPLVHYLASDLNAGDGAIWADSQTRANGIWQKDISGGLTDTTYNPVPTVPNVLNPGIAASGMDPNKSANSRYQPWGQPASGTVNDNNHNFSNPYNLIYKDPLVWDSDYWDFPTNTLPTVGWLGRVHRGSPWQSVYLKDRDVQTDNLVGNAQRGANTWAAWTGDNNIDAANSVPVQDRQLFDLFTTRFNDNAVHGALSVNQKNLAAWSAVFSGLVVLSNNLPDSSLSVLNASTTPLVIDPAGAAGGGSQLGQIVAGITNAQSGYANVDGLKGVFEHVGDILNTPALTEWSPFLHLSNYVNNAWVEDLPQKKYGISDEMYEWLPQQTLGLLRVGDTPRFVVYCFGQTLKPARDSLVLDNGTGEFGLCTNYQVTAESAARAVIRLERHITATGTNYTPVIESYNPLPPN